MLIMLLMNVIVLGLGALFVWLPEVIKLPSIVGYDIDAALVSGMGLVNRFFEIVWPLQIVFYGALFIAGYYIIKMGILLLLGSRAPK